MVVFLCMKAPICKMSPWPPIALPAYYLKGVTLISIRCYYHNVYFTIIMFHVIIFDDKYIQPNDVVDVLSLQKYADMKIFILL